MWRRRRRPTALAIPKRPVGCQRAGIRAASATSSTSSGRGPTDNNAHVDAGDERRAGSAGIGPACPHWAPCLADSTQPCLALPVDPRTHAQIVEGCFFAILRPCRTGAGAARAAFGPIQTIVAPAFHAPGGGRVGRSGGEDRLELDRRIPGGRRCDRTVPFPSVSDRDRAGRRLRGVTAIVSMDGHGLGATSLRWVAPSLGYRQRTKQASCAHQPAVKRRPGFRVRSDRQSAV